MTDITGKVLSVTGHPTQRGSMRYVVAFSDGNEYSTFENALAQKANGLAGQDVDIRVNVQQKPGQNGQVYTNRYINDIAPTGQLPAQDLQDQAGQTVGADGIPIVQSGGGGRRGGGGRGMTEADKTRMSIQNALGTSFAALSRLYAGAGPEALEELEEKAFALAHKIYAESRKHETTATVTNVEATPQAVAAAVPGVEVGTASVEAAQPETATPTPQW